MAGNVTTLEAMMIDAKFCNARARRAWGNTKFRDMGAKALGGRPKTTPPRPMTPRSRLINKLLKQGMESIAIAELLEASPSAVGGMIHRWGLPRDET